MHMKKVISVLMALIMVFSVFAISVNAWTGADTNQSIKIVTTADKTTVSPGDTVTFTIKLYYSDNSAFENALANTAISWMYNTSQITPTALTYGSELGNFSLVRPIGKIVAANPLSQVKTASTEAEQARYDANGYNAICKLQGMKDASTTNGAQGYWSIVDGEVVHTLTCTISDSVAPGTEINFDMISGLLAKNHTAFQFVDTANGNKATYKYGATYYDTTEGSVKLTVAAAGPAVAKSKAQVKMTPNSATTVEDAFSFRVTSVITDADWDTYFANSANPGATNNAIKRVGFVAYKGTAGFNLDTAKAVAQGSSAVGYDVATTDYIQKANDTSDAFFGCRLDITSAATRSDVTYVAFVQYLNASGETAYAFYDAEKQALLNTNYDTIVSTYLEAHPYAG